MYTYMYVRYNNYSWSVWECVLRESGHFLLSVAECLWHKFAFPETSVLGGVSMGGSHGMVQGVQASNLLQTRPHCSKGCCSESMNEGRISPNTIPQLYRKEL